MSLTVKAYFQKNPEASIEIRRFTVPVDASSSYVFMFKKISEVFPGMSSGNFVICWKDPENEMVACSSDEELLEALGYVENGILKVFIKEKKASTSEETTSEQATGEIHPHVVCDGCEGPVYGIRYKCCVCPDYDLCSTCERKNVHNEHDMLKISSPRSCGGKYPFVPPPHFRRWMRRFMHRWHNKNPNCSFKEGENETEAGVGETTPGSEEEKENPENTENTEEETTAEEEYLRKWGENISAMMDNFGIDVTFETDHDGKRKQGKCGRRGQGHFGRGGAHHPGPFGPHGHHPHGPHGGPFGPHGPPPQGPFGPHGGPFGHHEEHPQGPFGPQGPPPHGPFGPHDPHGAPPSSGPYCGPHGFAATFSPEGMFSCFQGPNFPGAKQRHGCKGKDKPKAKSSVFFGNGQTLNVDNRNGTTEVTDSQATSSSVKEEVPMADVQTTEAKTSTDTTPERETEWMVLDQNGSVITPIGNSVLTDQQNITIIGRPKTTSTVTSDAAAAATSPPTPAEPKHKDPKIAEAIDTMLSMGFDNEGGWLGHLLEAKGGDISQALDSIRPDRKTNGGYMA